MTPLGGSFLQSNTKGQSLRIQRNQEDDSDGPVYSDVDDAPTPPPHRRALGPTASDLYLRTEQTTVFTVRKRRGMKDDEIFK